MPLEFARLTSSSLETLPAGQTVFFFPVGPLEDHGPHLPMGMDILEANELCRMAARKLEAEMPGWVGVVMPTAPLGIDSNSSSIALRVRPHVLRDWLVDAVRSLMNSGFRNFVCFSGHLGPKQLTAIEEAGKLVSRKFGVPKRLFGRAPVFVSASSALVTPREVLRSPLKARPKEHGGGRDTSVALALQCEVGQEFLGLPDSSRPSGKHRFKTYWGSPKGATDEQGRKELQATVDTVFPKLRAALEGANPNFLFRSWYSVLPPNQSFFKAWILAITLLALMFAWLYLYIRSDLPV